jgi:enediyne biosynthesis protein E4
MPSWLFHNNGDGTFTDVSKASGIASHPGKVWGVVATDINNDGRMDLFVTNDTVANFLFVNQGDGKFSETGTEAGVAFGATGKARSGMGVDSADFNQDGWQDLFVANIDRENFAIYQNGRDGTFDDLAMPTGIAKATRLMSGWGLKFFDYDNDGDTDLFLSNGNPDDLINVLHGEVSYEEPLILFHRNGKMWEDVSSKSGPAFSMPISARGLALGDFDNDGAVDVLISVNGGAPVLLRNLAGKQNHWLGIRLIGKKSNIDAIGAEIKYKAGDLVRSRFKVGGGSYLSYHDPRVVLGLGKHEAIDWVEIRWPQPGGGTQRFTGLPVDRYITITEGEEKWR